MGNIFNLLFIYLFSVVDARFHISNNQIPMILTASVFLFSLSTHSDDDFKDDDIIFEDFARLRLKGGETEA